MRTRPTKTGAVAAAPLPLDTLTPREKDVLRGLTHGLSDLQIAHELCLYDATVKNYVRHLLRKMRMTRTEAAAYGAANDHDMPRVMSAGGEVAEPADTGIGGRCR